MMTKSPAHTHNACCFQLIVLLLIVALFSIFVPELALAQTPIRVQANEHTFVFGQLIRFQLQVSSDRPIRSIVLAYRTMDTQGTTVETMVFDTDTSVSVEYVHEIQQRYIRPFVELTYWWTIEDAAGSKTIIEPRSFVYADNRFDWQTLQSDNIHIHWYQGELESAQQALDIAIDGLNRARQDISVEAIRKPVDIYMYASNTDLRVAQPMSSNTEALTFYETSVILVAFAPQPANVLRAQRVLPHEVTHTLIHEATQNDFGRVPTWLSEGLATSVEYEFIPDPDANALLEKAIRERDTIPLNELCAGFPADQSRARLAYAQSASVIGFIRDVYGRQALRDLVAAYADGATCEGGVQRVLTMSLERLDDQWLASRLPRSGLAVFWDENGAWVLLLLLLVGVPGLFILPIHVQSSQPGSN